MLMEALATAIRVWLARQLKERSHRQTDLATALGVSASAVTRMLNGQRQISAVELVKAILVFQSPTALPDLLRMVRGAEDLKIVECLQEFSGGLAHEHSNEDLDSFFRYMLRIVEEFGVGELLIHQIGIDPVTVGAVEMMGDAMVPFLKDRDIAFYDKTSRDASRPGVFVFKEPLSGLVARRLELGKPTSDGPTVIVRADNPLYPPREMPLSAIEILGRVAARYLVESRL